MADFCKTCSQRVTGEDTRDLAGLCEEGQTVICLCEGCGGNVEVDHNGEKIEGGVFEKI